MAKLRRHAVGLFGPAMISKQARMALLRTSLAENPNIDDLRHKPIWLNSVTARVRALYGGKCLRITQIPSSNQKTCSFR